MKHKLVLSTWISLLVLLGACQPESLQTLPSTGINSPPPPGSSILSNACDISFHADIETFSFSRPADANESEALSDLDKTAEMPVVQRVDIQICDRANGGSEWFIQAKKPQTEIPVNHETPVDDTPTFSHAYILDDMAKIYDTEGQEMGQATYELPDFRYLLNFTPGSREALWEQAVIQAKENGIILAEVEDEFVDIKNVDPQSGDQTIIMLDLINQVMVGTSVLDANGEPKLHVSFTYDQGGESPVLRSMYQALYETSLSSEIPMIFETHTIFHSFSFQKNQ